jgi:hypothetical protein
MSAGPDPDELTRPEAVALYRELEQRAAALRAGPARPRLPVRRWFVLAPVAAGLAVAAAVATHSLTGPGATAPPGNAAPNNRPLITTGQLPLIPGQRVASVTHHGGTTTIRYRSGLVEVIPRLGAPTAIGPRSLVVTLGGRRVILSGLDPAHLRRAAGTLAAEGPLP